MSLPGPSSPPTFKESGSGRSKTAKDEYWTEKIACLRGETIHVKSFLQLDMDGFADTHPQTEAAD